MVVSSVVVEFDLPNEFDLDSMVLEAVRFAMQCHVHLKRVNCLATLL